MFAHDIHSLLFMLLAQKLHRGQLQNHKMGMSVNHPCSTQKSDMNILLWLKCCCFILEVGDLGV